MSFLAQYGMFLLKCMTLTFAILVTLAGIVAITRKSDPQDKRKLRIKHLNKSMLEKMTEMNEALLSKKAFKQFCKEMKNSKKDSSEKSRLFVLDFKGDMKGSEVESLREMVTNLISIAHEKDEVMLRLESPGGLVTAYGLAASQLSRLKDAGISLTVAIDQVAASGGYLMACVADKILAAPFAIIGSIGVITALPNFNRLLKKHDIDYEQITAGEYKRTLTVFGENTDEARAKKQEQVNEIHQLFKSFVAKNRPQIDINQVATGEYWLACDTLALKLVDTIQTSDDYLWGYRDEKEIYSLSMSKNKSIIEKLISKGEDVGMRFGLINRTGL